MFDIQGDNDRYKYTIKCQNNKKKKPWGYGWPCQKICSDLENLWKYIEKDFLKMPLIPSFFLFLGFGTLRAHILYTEEWDDNWQVHIPYTMVHVWKFSQNLFLGSSSLNW